ncbi:MAG: hypothetical protein ACOCVF_01500 [bacterium]
MDTRELLRRMRNFENGINEDFLKKEAVNESKKSLSMRDMLGRMRKHKMQEQDDEQSGLEPAPITPTEQRKEEEKFEKFFNNNIVDIEFNDLLVYDNAIFWSGTIDNQLKWVFKVSPDEQNSGVEIKYLEGFEPTDPENDELVKKIEAYYNTFYKYWRNNELQIDKT